MREMWIVWCLITITTTITSSSNSTHDFIIIGAGSTGSVVAGRLASAGYDVLVLESGGRTQYELGGCEDNPCPDIPDTNTTVFDIPSQWIRTITEENFEYIIETASSHDTAPKQARGVGGCGIHNAMIYIRGTPYDFDTGSWSKLNWTWDEVLPFYTRTENNTFFSRSSHHSNTGPVQISFASDSGSSFDETFLKACSRRSQRNLDFNGIQREGCGEYQFLIRDGVRDSSAVAFLSPSRQDRGSLEIRPYSHVTKIMFNGSTAVGVEYVNTKEQPTSKDTMKRHVVHVKREIILSAGAIHSPNILLQSGLRTCLFFSYRKLHIESYEKLNCARTQVTQI